MENCLLNQLKAESSNTNLLKVGSIGINFLSGNGNANVGCYGSNITAVIHGNGHFSNSSYSSDLGTTMSISSNVFTNMYVVASEDVVVEIQNVSYTQYLGVFLETNCYIKDIDVIMKYRNVRNATCAYNEALSPRNIFDLVYCAPHTNMQRLKFPGSNAHGNIYSLSAITEMLELELYNTSVVGDISSLNALKKLTACYFGQTSVEGTLEDLLEAWLAAGKTGTVNCGFTNTGVTLHNSAMANNISVVFSTNSIVVTDRTTSATLATFDGTSWSY